MTAVSERHLRIDSSQAQLMTMPVFPTTADPQRLQRVADLLATFNEIPALSPPVPGGRISDLDMRGMVVPAAPWSTVGR